MKRLTVLALCLMLGVSSLTACGQTDKSAKKPPVVEEEEKVYQDTFESGVFDTESYTVTLGKSGFAKDGKYVLDYTIENKSDKKIKADEIFGFNLKVGQFEEALVLSRLSDELAEVMETKTDVFHKDIKSGATQEGSLVFEVPEGKEEIDIQVKALDTKSNKSLGEYTLDKEEYEIETGEKTEQTEKNDTKKKEETEKEVPKEERTGADDALDLTEKDIKEE